MSKFKQMMKYIWKRLTHTLEHDQGKSHYFLIVSFLFSSLIAIYTAMGAPTGIAFHTRMLDSLLAMALNVLAYSIFSFLLAFILSLCRIPIPRLSFSTTLYVGLLTTIVLEKASSGLHFSIIIGLLFISATICTSLLTYLFWQTKKGRLLFLLLLSITVMAINLPQIIPFSDWVASHPSDESSLLHGDYEPLFLTYGSGLDVHRKEFHSDISVQTNSVDASHFITKWGDKREKFWHFGPEDFPINGRVWMPDGDGPFPVVLMVHGNHTMEYLSTAGYDYLGELLASQGFFFVSVDEDFVNYSNITGQPNNNYELRAWLLLQHLIQLQEMNNDVDHPFYEKLDFQKVALGGHSRGGQAAAMAADYRTFFPNETEMISLIDNMNIEAVFALSPTDRSIDSKKANLHHTSYLTLHGSHDTDVYSFRGDFQFYRTTFDPSDHHLRSTVYIENANHVHFNTDWGNRDLSLPRGAILNVGDLIPAKEQQKIAKVYISAFLQTVLQKKDDYRALFEQDDRTKSWLPDTSIISKYRPATYKQLYAFTELPEPPTYFAEYDELTTYQPVNRSNLNYAKPSMLLSWNERAFHKINFDTAQLINTANQRAEQIVLTVANFTSDGNQPTLDITLVAEGEKIDNFQYELSPMIQIDSTVLGLFDDIFRDGKYEQKADPIFENIHIPLDKLPNSFDGQIEIHIEFSGDNGQVLLEEIGLY